MSRNESSTTRQLVMCQACGGLLVTLREAFANVTKARMQAAANGVDPAKAKGLAQCQCGAWHQLSSTREAGVKASRVLL